VILLDEPFGALDALTRLEVQSTFLELRRTLPKTMILVTHDLGEALRVGDRVAVMHSGQILQVAPPAELVTRPAHPYVRRLVELAGGSTS